jgi:hypothetical protein
MDRFVDDAASIIVDIAAYPRRDAGHDDTVRYVLRHDAPGSDNHTDPMETPGITIALMPHHMVTDRYRRNDVDIWVFPRNIHAPLSRVTN